MKYVLQICGCLCILAFIEVNGFKHAWLAGVGLLAMSVGQERGKSPAAPGQEKESE